jgi:hypothetical protein
MIYLSGIGAPEASAALPHLLYHKKTNQQNPKKNNNLFFLQHHLELKSLKLFSLVETILKKKECLAKC